MIKHRAVAIRGMLPDGSQEETFVRIGGSILAQELQPNCQTEFS